jgi:hypothetical protein
MLVGHAGAQDCVEPPPGLVGWWPGDGDFGDISGKGNAGLPLGGAGFAPGKVGEAFSFDGIDDWVRVPRVVQDDFSLMAWVRTTQTGHNPACASGRSDWFCGFGIVDAEVGGFFDDFGMSMFEGRLAFGVSSADQTTTTILSTSSINSGGWTHVAATRTRSTGEIAVYVNGVRENSGVAQTGALTSPAFIAIGQDSTTDPRGFFEGLIDEVEIDNRALEASEIQAIFDAGSAGKCKPPPPPTPEELLQRIEDLEAAVDELSDHTHTYRTGRGRGHNNTEAETGPAEEPSDDPNQQMTPLGAGFRVRPLSR